MNTYSFPHRTLAPSAAALLMAGLAASCGAPDERTARARGPVPAASPAPAPAPVASRRAEWTGGMFDAAVRRGLSRDGLLLFVSVREQSLWAVGAGGVEFRAPVSTARLGIGSQQDSGRTPLGLHRVVERYGDGRPAGQVFDGRQTVARVCPESEWRRPGGDDLVLTRILRLAGLIPGLNQGPGVDSFSRYIYIHGTNQEHLLGTPASHGCVRMGNRDVIALFDLARGRDVWCSILERFEDGHEG